MDVVAGWRNRQGAGLGRTGRVVDEPVVPVRLVVNSAGLAGGEAGLHIQRSSCGLSRETTEVAAPQENCFDAEPIL
jgi:hypothetical protein